MSNEIATQLERQVARYRNDPLGYVGFAFPWGQHGTVLEHERGPEPWQHDLLEQLGKNLKAVQSAVEGTPDLTSEAGRAKEVEATRIAVASGHGIGKSALVAWIVLWALSTCPDTRGIVTANTDAQLRTKTWPELAKWLRLAKNGKWFTYTATALHSARPGRERTWRVDAVTWSENNTEAIAGLHNKGKRAFAIFDEASAIPDPVWETIEGALTDAGTELFWTVFGNPTRSSGRFRECFAGGRFAHRWSPRQIDSRAVAMTNKSQIATWVKDYGEDSDFVRVRVRGAFPRAGSMQFIDSARIQEAVDRPLEKDPTAPLVMGVDIARHGDDQTVIRFRRGLDARSIPAIKFRIPDLMLVASRIMEQVNSHNPDAVFVDATGIGWGVCDRLSQLGCQRAVGIDFGGGPTRTRAASGDAAAKYANKRAEMWGFMKDWLKSGCVPDDAELVADLGNVEYGYNGADALLLERKDDMRRRGLASPDDGDALALTFAHPVAKRDYAEERRYEEGLKRLRRMVV
ncbi:MAG: terminase [Alphaproteobacteria bacterium]|nr:terminase [Alphaproteobacteria bacterium]